jgi:methionine biosynthesis protein MetW
MTLSLLREDLRIIAGLVPEGAKVLDIGCGDGELLAWLKAHKQVDARGLEREHDKVSLCIRKGLAVIQGNAETDLHFYPKRSHDVVVLSRTLQAMQDPVQVLQQILRISQQAIVSIPNFGYWKNRAYLGFKGRMPVTSTLTYQWYNTPNIHFCTLHDFAELCHELQIPIAQRITINREGKRSAFQQGIVLPNLLAEQAVFVIGGK